MENEKYNCFATHTKKRMVCNFFERKDDFLLENNLGPGSNFFGAS